MHRLSHFKSVWLINQRPLLLLLFWSVVYFVAIFQDFLEAKLRHTGFYWSETMLYNTYWLWFIPFIYLLRMSYGRLRPSNLVARITFQIVMGVFLCFLHVLLFTSLFIVISNLVFTHPHRFSRIFESVLSNQVYITLIAYFFAPFLFDFTRRRSPAPKTEFPASIEVKKGSRRIRIDIGTIQAITANRPYSEIRVDEKSYLHNASLKAMEQKLPPQLFIRVHRSVLVNKDHVVEIKSRKNGDYDALLTNGQMIRLSRHFRDNWNALLIH